MTDQAPSSVGAEEARLSAAVTAALRRMRVPEQRWGTVETWDVLTNRTTIIVDGDDQAVPVQNATNASLSPGQRALVLFAPPSSATIIGARPGRPIEYTPELTSVDVDDGTTVGWWAISGGWVDLAAMFELGTAGDVTGTIAFSLPVPYTAELSQNPVLCQARALLGTTRYVGEAFFTSGAPTIIGSFASVEGLWDATDPGAWAPGDAMRITARYPMRLPTEV